MATSHPLATPLPVVWKRCMRRVVCEGHGKKPPGSHLGKVLGQEMQEDCEKARQEELTCQEIVAEAGKAVGLK